MTEEAQAILAQPAAPANPKKKVPWYETWTFLILVFVGLPLAFRSLVYSPFHIPSGSMKSTLLIGDYIFVSKYTYGYSRYSFPFGIKWFDGRILKDTPKRGDIIVFRYPADTSVDYIKRLMGLPGDRIQVKDGELYINRVKMNREQIEDFMDEDIFERTYPIKQYVETLPEGQKHLVLDEKPDGNLDNTPEYVVPSGHYFFMGDNRDNSMDSRVLNLVGFVPEENLVGRADVIFLSTRFPLWEIWNWHKGFRWERMFTRLE